MCLARTQLKRDAFRMIADANHSWHRGPFRDPHNALHVCKENRLVASLGPAYGSRFRSSQHGFLDSRILTGKNSGLPTNGASLFGFTSSETLNIEKFFQRLHPNDRETTRQALEDAYKGDGTYQTEHSVLLRMVRYAGFLVMVESN